jgi:lipopolysaccharide export LptBFGC system permease protein LptF
VTKTLHWYLSRELGRVTLLALVSLTLLMTVFGVIEPMREVGVSSDQVLALFGYLVPVMLSLTLPVAALFAGTIVYGRFSQDNELTACRASGVSTLTVLKPALVLGGIVTVITLVLGNFVAPGMLAGAEQSVKKNIAGIVFPQLRKMNYIKWGTRIIHADRADPESKTLHGVVAIDAEKQENIGVVMATTAQVDFGTHEGNSYAVIYADNAAIAPPGQLSFIKESFTPFRFRIPSPTEEKPSWYGWGKLVATLRNPAKNKRIDKELTGIKRRICHDMLAREIAEAVEDGQPYILREPERAYEIRAAGAHVIKKETVQLSSGLGTDGKSTPVEIKILHSDAVNQIITGDSGKIKATWSEFTNVSSVAIELIGGVVVRGPGGDQHVRTQWVRGEIEIPEHIKKGAEQIHLVEVYSDPEQVTSNPSIQAQIKELKDGEIKKLLLKIKAEMHGRVAYGVSCFLLVILGSGLGLLFRGGQLISAFAIALVPGAVVIVMVIMGKEIVKNPDVPDVLGLGCIWGGILILGAASVLIYLHLVRK